MFLHPHHVLIGCGFFFFFNFNKIRFAGDAISSLRQTEIGKKNDGNQEHPLCLKQKEETSG